MEGAGQRLLRFAALLSSLLGVAPGGSVKTLPPGRYHEALALLRPLESALRRLIVIRAKGRALPPAPPPSPRGATPRGSKLGSGRSRPPQFRLWDRRKRLEPPRFANPRCPPRITVVGLDEWTPYPRPAKRDPAAPMDAQRLCRRFHALSRALDAPETQVERLLRWRAARRARRAGGAFVRYVDPLRPGLPPGYRRRGRAPIHTLLHELCRLALMAEREGSA